MEKQKTICFVAGKSGGHLIPALTIAQKHIQKDSEITTIFFTTNSLLDKKIIKKSGIHKIHVQLPLGKNNLVKNNYNFFLKYPLLFFNLSLSFAKSLFYLIKTRPQKIISMGGLVSIPVCVAGFLLRIPIELFELNTTPGKAITFLAPFAKTIHVCFDKAKKYLPKHKCIFSKYPVRFSHNFPTNYPINSQKINFNTFNTPTLSKSKFTLLILGGSQGSLAINNLIKEFVIKAPNIKKIKKNIQIIHQTGRQDKTDWQAFYAKHKITATAFDFTQNISNYYAMADIVVCRSGAGTLFETIFFKKKCITIPLEAKTTDHQIDNAKEMEKMHPELVTMIKQDFQCTELFITEICKQIAYFLKQTG